MQRVKDDDRLKVGFDPRGDQRIENPIIVIHNIGDGKQRYLLDLMELDEGLREPKTFGIVLSDLLDHIAAAYAHQTKRDERDVRAEIMKVFRDEDRFKDKDPSRGRMTGATWKPPSN